MKKAIALVLAAGAASVASAAGTLVVTLVPASGSMGPGGTMQVDIYADYSGIVGGLCLAGFKFDVLGDSNGTLTGDVNDVFSNGLTNGTPSGANLLDFAGGQLPPALGGGNLTTYVGSVFYTDSGTAGSSYTVTLDLTDYVATTGAFNVYIGASGTQSRSSLTSSTGNNHLLDIIATPFDVIVPTPASMALLGLGGLVAGRRRR